MIEKPGLIQAKDFKIGLFTQSDIVNSDPNLSPNTMDVQWFFDSTIGKRLGNSTANSAAITVGGGVTGFIVGGTLTSGLQAYWKMDESSDTRYDSIGSNNLGAANNPLSTTGIRNQGALFVRADSTALVISSSSLLGVTGANSWTIGGWFMLTDTSAGVDIALAMKVSTFKLEVRTFDKKLQLEVNTGSFANPAYSLLSSNSFGALTQNVWYNWVAWSSANSHIGLSVNLSADTLAMSSGPFATSANWLSFGAFVNENTSGGQIDECMSGRIDEVGVWNRVLTAAERANLWAGGSGNTFTSATEAFSWYSFDFGATGVRWYTVAAGTGVVASSNLGISFVTIATQRTATFQYMDRSKNVLIMTSDAYDQTLYWAGSAGTSAIALAVNSAPKAKFSINYQGFLVLLNSADSNGTISSRRFSYADENLQLTDQWNNGFDIPSSSDDEITAPFILNKFLYISTKYKIFRLNYTGGNPDWQYIQVKNYGYVPRTVKVFTLKQGQVAVGLDWSRRLRAFDGYDDQIISDNVYSDNDYCNFAMSKISLAGSGLLISNAEFDPNYQEYRLNVAIGAQSTQTTHAIVLNARTLAMYPYSNQQFNTICIAESAGQQFLMAVDRSGFVHIMNSGNLDVTTPINEVYDSPLMYNNSPSSVTKNRQLNFYFGHDSCGKVYHQQAFDFSRLFSPMKALRDYSGNEDLTGNESSLLIQRTVDLTSVNNTYQFRLTSSAGTANPWKLTYFDYLNSALGYGRGK